MSEQTGRSEVGGPRLAHLSLDPTLYDPKPHELQFFKQQTGIQDEEELKAHILSVQKEAWDVVNYGCIRNFAFTRLNISQMSPYESFLNIAKKRPDAIFLEFACCFGNDLRKAVADGWPVENAIASDLQQEFWDLGHKLFRTTPQTFPVPFVQGDVFDHNLIKPAPPCYDAPSTPRPDLQKLTSLTPLQGHVSAIHVTAFFHLFDLSGQVHAAKALASLLSPVPGSMIFGLYASFPESGSRDLGASRKVHGFSAEDWKKMWNGDIFKEGTVQVETMNVERENFAGRDRGGTVDGIILIVWSLKRL